MEIGRVMKLSNNFSLWEFAPKGFPKDWKPTNPYQLFLIKLLATELQIVSDAINNSPIKITSGVRTKYDYNRLKKAGYYPSPTSDHYCGTPVCGETRKAKFFEGIYPFATGAVDIQVPNMKLDEVFNTIVKLQRSGKVSFGQIIYEGGWIHISNSMDNVLRGLREGGILNHSGDIMVSSNSGKSYNRIEVIGDKKVCL